MQRFSAFLPAALVSIIFAGSNIAARVISNTTLSTSLIIMIRMGLVLLCLGAFMRWKPFRNLARHHTVSLILAGVCNLAINLGVFYSLKYTSLTNFAMISAINPVLTMLLSALIYRTKLKPKYIFAVILSLIGVMTVVLGKSGASLVALNIGDLIAVTVAISWAVYAIVVRHISKVLHAKHVNFGTALIAFGLIFSFSLFNGLDITLLSQLNFTEICAFGYLGAIGTALAYTLFAFSVKEIGPSLTALIAFSMTPLYTALLAYLFLGEIVTVWQLVGGLLIMISVGLAVSD
jgi:drug/metabolite transporter (DMT)-like permease